MIPQVLQRCGGAIGAGEAEGHHECTNNNECDNGDNLNDSKPEFDFAEVLHRGQVQQ